MKCLRIKRQEDGDHNIYVLVKEEIPPINEHDVLVEVKACTLSPVQLQVFKELFPNSSDDGCCVGYDVSGIIKASGCRVMRFAEGDEVVGVLPLHSSLSGCGEFCIFNEFDIVNKPSRVNHEDAAAVIGDAVRAYTALHYHSHIGCGDKVLILDGATSSGHIAIQLAQQWKAMVITTFSNLAEKQFIKSNHEKPVICLELSDPSTLLVDKVMEETGGAGVDCILDNGVKEFKIEEDFVSLEENTHLRPHKHDLLRCLGFSGKWVTSQFDLQLDPPDNLQLFLRNAGVCFLFPPSWTLTHAKQGQYQHILADIMEKLEKGHLRCQITKIVRSLEEATLAMDDIRVGKVVLSLIERLSLLPPSPSAIGIPVDTVHTLTCHPQLSDASMSWACDVSFPALFIMWAMFTWFTETDGIISAFRWLYLTMILGSNLKIDDWTHKKIISMMLKYGLKRHFCKAGG